VFWTETATTGWLRHSRGFIIGGEPAPDGGGAGTDTSTKTITQAGHGFSVGDWLYVSADLTYAKGLSTVLTSSQAVGVVIQVIDVNTFKLQQSGDLAGVVTQDKDGNPIASSIIYYLTDDVAHPGLLQNVAPVTLGHYSKPLWVQDDLALNSGWILEQRPLIVSAPVTAGGDQLIQTFTLNNGDMFLDMGAALLDGTYTDIKIVGRGITVADGTGNNAANALKMRVYTNGVLRNGALGYRIFPNSGGGSAFSNAHLFFTQFGALNGTFGTNGGGSFQFEAEIRNCPSATLYKNVYQTNITVQNVTLPPNTGAPSIPNISDIAHGAGGANTTENDSWMYIGDTLPITGFYMFLDYPVGANTAFFTGGTISVYGTVA
jgi:hypothetical protein